MRPKVHLLFCALCACVLQGASSCPTLSVPAYGTLIFNGTDIHDRQPAEYRQNDTVQYQCAQGYTLVGDNGGSVGTSAICQSDEQWSLLNVTCSVHNCGSPPAVENADSPSGMTTFGSLVTYNCKSGYSPDRDSAAVCSMSGWINVPNCQVVPLLMTLEILIIVASGLGGVLLILLILMVVLCCKLCQLNSKLNAGNLAEDEIAFALSQGGFSLSNPLVGVKDAEDAAGSPLYLTPDEMNDFEHKNV